MKRSSLRRSSGLAAVALSLSLGLAACGGAEDESPAAANDDTSSETSDSGAEETTTTGSEPFGPGCAAIPKEGDGSFNGMATAPVATAASANPLLETLVAAVTEAGLGDALNSAEELTVFAPTNDAFAKIPAKDLEAVLADKKLLTQILTHHVVPQRLSPEEVAGEHETLAKDTLTVEGSGEEFVADTEEQANVICGNIQTANATVYVVDTVMMPQM